MAEKKDSKSTKESESQEPERDSNPDDALEGTGDGTSADATGAAIQDEVDAAEEDDDK